MTWVIAGGGSDWLELARLKATPCAARSWSRWRWVKPALPLQPEQLPAEQ